MNAVQSSSAATIEQLIASALKEFETKFQINPQSSSQSPSTETKQITDAKKKNSMQCFFCKKFGHAKNSVELTRLGLANSRQKSTI